MADAFADDTVHRGHANRFGFLRLVEAAHIGDCQLDRIEIFGIEFSPGIGQFGAGDA